MIQIILFKYKIQDIQIMSANKPKKTSGYSQGICKHWQAGNVVLGKGGG